MRKRIWVAFGAASLLGMTPAWSASVDDPWYAGGKIGWSSWRDRDFRTGLAAPSTSGLNGVGAGALLGYQFNPWLGVEGGYDYLNQFHFTAANLGGRQTFSGQGLQLSAKLGLPLAVAGSDVYARLGGMVARTTGLGTSNYGLSPLAAVGLEYPFSHHWAGRLEYQWTHNVGNSNTVGVRADNHLVSIGLLYRFGGALAAAPAPVQPAPPMVAPPPAPAAPIMPREFNLNSDVLFDFNKSLLKPSGVSALNTLLSQLQAQTPRDANINVVGYTDRLGSESYNLGLSQRRAQTVAAYLTSHGIPASRVSSEGRGKADPVTAGRCDGIKKRPALIQCLSPDRRVVVRVAGTSATQ